MSFKALLSVCVTLTMGLLVWQAHADEILVVGEGREVSLEYTLTLDDGTLADSNVGDLPYIYVHGRQQILPTLEAALVGLSVGDVREVRLTAEEGYGPVDPALLQAVPLEAVPEEGRHVGEVLIGADAEGQPFQVRVAEIREDVVVLDFNHPLAGQALNFAVKVLAVH